MQWVNSYKWLPHPDSFIKVILNLHFCHGRLHLSIKYIFDLVTHLWSCNHTSWFHFGTMEYLILLFYSTLIFKEVEMKCIFTSTSLETIILLKQYLITYSIFVWLQHEEKYWQWNMGKVKFPAGWLILRL